MGSNGNNRLTTLEICAGAGGQALGISRAGFAHVGLVEIEPDYCATLERNRPGWNVVNADLREFDGSGFAGVDLLAGGVPCPPFSIAGKGLGADDERDLFPQALRLVDEVRPRAVMIENVRGLLSPQFDEYRESILAELRSKGYRVWMELLNASDFGVPQLRPRVVIVGLRADVRADFEFPGDEARREPPTVGNAIVDYLRHGRPDCDLPQVIVSAGSPATARPIGPATVHSIVTKHISRADLDGWRDKRHGAHALRHSLATNMLGGGVALPVIAEVLGHQSTETTNAYLRLDVSSLSGCALPMPAMRSPHYGEVS
jgi:site-specific DNA-cytosine methylase